MADSDYVPVGAIVPLGRTLPSENNYMLCDGRELDGVSFSELYDAIGTTYGGSTDTKRFNLPDLRGNFPRGSGSAPAAPIGTAQDWATGRPQNPFWCSVWLPTERGITGTHGVTKTGAMERGGDKRVDSCAGGDADTRPINVYVEYYIKIQS